MAFPDPSPDRFQANDGGDSAAPENCLNPAAPQFLPNVNPRVHVKLTLNPSFHYYLYPQQTPPPPCFFPATFTSPPSFLVYYPLYDQNYSFNPSLPIQPLPPSQPDRLPQLATTEPNPNNPLSGQVHLAGDKAKIEGGRRRREDKVNGRCNLPNYGGIKENIGRRKGRRGDFGGPGRGVCGAGNLSVDWYDSARVVYRPKRHSVVPLQTNSQITTVMIRNIPNKYTRELLIEFLDKYCQEENKKEKHKVEHCDSEENEIVCSAYDFLYLPIDFKSGMNKGYAFVNFTDGRAAWKLKSAYNDREWELFNSKKRLEVASARIQGKDNLVSHFERMTYPVAKYSAVYFSPARCGTTDGPTIVRTVMVGKCMH